MFLLSLTEKTADISQCLHWFPHGNNVIGSNTVYSYWWGDSLPRSWCYLWLVIPQGKFASANQKHYPELGSDLSLLRNFCIHFSNLIWHHDGNQWWYPKMLAVSQAIKWVQFHFLLLFADSCLLDILHFDGYHKHPNVLACHAHYCEWQSGSIVEHVFWFISWPCCNNVCCQHERIICGI